MGMPGSGIMARDGQLVPAAAGEAMKSAMRTVLLCLAAMWAAAAASQASAGTVTDSAGRKVDVPDEIRTVYAAGGPASGLFFDSVAVTGVLVDVPRNNVHAPWELYR